VYSDDFDRISTGGIGLFKDARNAHDYPMAIFKRIRRLLDAYRFPGFRPRPAVVGVMGEPGVRVVTLVRRSKKRRAGRAAGRAWVGTTGRSDRSATSRAATCACTSTSRSGGSTAGRVAA
jgi:hypothetical protein